MLFIVYCNANPFIFDGHIGDKFLNLVEPFAAETPYMTCPGNHENK
jgi:hypothetical protein